MYLYPNNILHEVKQYIDPHLTLRYLPFCPKKEPLKGSTTSSARCSRYECTKLNIDFAMWYIGLWGIGNSCGKIFGVHRRLMTGSGTQHRWRATFVHSWSNCQVSCPNTQRLVCGSAPKRTRVRASLVCCCNRCRHPYCCTPVLPLFSLRCFYSEPSILQGGAATTAHVCGRGEDGWRQQQCSS
jgi:hypothetical protein